jgi:hypothetical protein
MKRSGSQRAKAAEPVTWLDQAVLASAGGGRFSFLGGGKGKDTPGSGTSGKDKPDGAPRQSTGETVKQAAIFGTAFTGLGIAGNSMFGPDQSDNDQTQAPPPSQEPLDYL